MTKKTIFFRVDGDDGTKVGLGHLNRIVKIFFNIKKKYNRKFDYVFILKEYKTGKKFLKKKIKNKLKIIPYNKLNKIIINNKDIFIFLYYLTQRRFYDSHICGVNTSKNYIFMFIIKLV